MVRLYIALIVVHGLLHFMGVAKAFGLAELPQLTEPISKAYGVVWGCAGMLLFATAFMLVHSPRAWWAVGLAAVLLSQAVIFTSWDDAKWGTIANVLVLVGVVYGFAFEGPFSLRAEYRRSVSERLQDPERQEVVTEADLAPLPEALRRYLRVTGVVGQPRVHHFRVRWRGRIRGNRADAWMEFTAEQYNFVDEPSRFFLMDAQRGFLPLDVLHVFKNATASMRVRLFSLIQLVNARGPAMTRAETVTLFNDVCLFAPAGLIDAAIEWEEIDSNTIRGRYTLDSNTISAILSFNEAGELEDFVSDDRLALSPDGTEFTRQRWSTPVDDYRSFGPRRLPSKGEGRWHPPGGEEFVYFEARVLDFEVNGST